jgi:flagellar transcriptional activator FlhD
MQPSNHTSTVVKEIEMNAKQLHEEIKATNLSYMGLVQKMIRADKAATTASLGVSEEMADLVSGLSPAQLQKMSGTNLLLCCFRFDESLLLNMITDHQVNRGMTTEPSSPKRVRALAA